jgi:hypothetical protein
MPILWLASFPKSGNTWARALLANYIAGSEAGVDINKLPTFALADSGIWAYERAAGRKLPDATLEDIMPLKPKAHAAIANINQNLVFAKTHSALRVLHGVPTITPDVTAGAVYILRNPLDIVLSYADHYGLSHTDTVDAISSKNLITMGRADRAPEYLGNWSAHVRGWTRAPGLVRTVLRYEDMQADAGKALRQILNMLRQPIDEAKILQAVRNSTFDALQSQEALKGFNEKSRNQKRFFRAGTAGQWRTELAPDLVTSIIEQHRDVMTEFGYLDADDNPS